jgi:hypothetical protein
MFTLEKNFQKFTELGVVVHACNLGYLGGWGRGIWKPAQAKLVRPYIKNKRQTKDLGMWLSMRGCKDKVLGSMSSSAKQKNHLTIIKIGLHGE